MRRKAQGLSLNTIIIAALALLVLVIVAVIFTGRAGLFRVESGSCDNNGGQCVRTDCDGAFQRSVGHDCNLDGDDTLNEGQAIDGICCIST